jgi:hypothetical protein
MESDGREPSQAGPADVAVLPIRYRRTHELLDKETLNG